MTNPTNLLYAKSHEWVQDMGDGSFRIGLTDYAQKELGDLVFVNLPQEGDEVEVGSAFGDGSFRCIQPSQRRCLRNQ